MPSQRQSSDGRAGQAGGPVVSRRRAIGLTGIAMAAAAGWTAGESRAEAADGTADGFAGIRRPGPNAGPVHTVQHGRSQITVFAEATQDVTALWYVITNGDKRQRHYTLNALDKRSKHRSKDRTVNVAAGGSFSGALYGKVNRTFDVTVFPDGEVCLTVGAVGGVKGTQGNRTRGIITS